MNVSRREFDELKRRLEDTERRLLQMIRAAGVQASTIRIRFCRTIGEHQAQATQPIKLLRGGTPGSFVDDDVKPDGWNMTEDVDIEDNVLCVAMKIRDDETAWTIIQIAKCE